MGRGTHRATSTSAQPLSTPWDLLLQPGPGSATDDDQQLQPSPLQGALGNMDHLQTPSIAAASIHGRGTAGHLPGPSYAPRLSTHSSMLTASPMEHPYGHPQLQPVPSSGFFPAPPTTKKIQNQSLPPSKFRRLRVSSIPTSTVREVLRGVSELGPGKSQPTQQRCKPASTAKLPESNGKSKMGEDSKASASVRGPRRQDLTPVRSTSGPSTVQTSPVAKTRPGNVPSRDEKTTTIPQAEETPLKSIAAQSPEEGEYIIRVKCTWRKRQKSESSNEKTLSKDQAEEKAKEIVSLPGTKGRNNSRKASSETLRMVPVHTLTLQLADSGQDLRPLGKKPPSAMPEIKPAPVASSSGLGRKPAAREQPPPKPARARSRQEPKEPLPALIVKSLHSSTVLPVPSPPPAPGSTERPPASAAARPAPGPSRREASATTARPARSSTRVPAPPSMARPVPSAASRAPPSSLAKPKLITRAWQLPPPKHRGFHPFDLQPQHLSEAPWRKARADEAWRVAFLSKRADLPKKSSWRPACSQQGPRITQPSGPPLCREPRCPEAPPPSPAQQFVGDTFIPWSSPPDDLEVSQPISEEQWFTREWMKKEAQREREEAAQWTSAGRVQYFEEEQEEMDTSNGSGCPWRHWQQKS